MRKTRLYTALLLLGVASGAHALGLGEIEVSSDLFQPLRADIRIHGGDEVPLDNLRATLGSENAFLRANLERPFFLRGLRMQVVRNDDGEAVIRVTTRTPVREPMLEFLVDVEWPGGRLQRQYAVLLDPPVRAPTPPVVASDAPAAAAAPASPRPAPRQAAAPAASTAPAASATAAQTGGAAQTAAATATAAATTPVETPAAPRTYRVRRNDTLGRIAERLRPDPSLSVNQIMLALLDDNPQAFTGANINNLRQGAELTVPTAERIARIAPDEATARVRQQYADWRAARQPAPAQPPAPPTRVAEAAESKEGLRLVPTVAEPSRAASVGDARTGTVANNPLAQELERTRELLYEREAELDVLRSRMAVYENDLRELNKTVQALRDEMAANASAAAVVTAVPPPAPEPATRGLDITPILIGMLLALGGFGLFTFIYRLFRGGAQTPAPAAATATPLEIGQALPIRDLGPATPPTDPVEAPPASAQPPTQQYEAAAVDIARQQQPEPPPPAAEADVRDLTAGKDTADRLAVEVDVLIQFGFFQRARELLEASLDMEPGRNYYRLKMLELYHAAEDAEGFVREARALQEHLGEGEEDLWESATEMAATLCPDEPLFQTSALAARGSGRANEPPRPAAPHAEEEEQGAGDSPFHHTGELDVVGEPLGEGEEQTKEWEFSAPATGETPAAEDAGEDDGDEELGEWILDEDLEHEADGTPVVDIDVDTSNWEIDQTLTGDGAARSPSSQEELEATHQWAFSKEEAGKRTEQLDFGDTQEIPPLLVDDLDEVLDDEPPEAPGKGGSTSEWSLTGELDAHDDDGEQDTGEWRQHGERTETSDRRGESDTSLWPSVPDPQVPSGGATDEHPMTPDGPGKTQDYPAQGPEDPDEDPDSRDGGPGPRRRTG